MASETGTGKTTVAVECIDPADVTLIIAPINTHSAWIETVAAQKGLDTRVIDNKDRDNKDFHRLKSGEPGVYLIGTEFFYIAAKELPKKKGLAITGKALVPLSRVVFDNAATGKRAGSAWAQEDGTFSLRTTKISDMQDLVPLTAVDMESLACGEYETRGRKRRWKWSQVKTVDTVILDECQSAANRESEMFKTLKQLKTHLKIALSATPGGDGFQGLWAVCRWLWPSAQNSEGQLVVDSSKFRWCCQWMDAEYDPFSTTNKKFTKERVPGAFVASLPCYIREEAERLPVNPWYVVKREMTPSQKKQYDDMVAQGVAWLQENPIIADLSIVQKVRLRQMCLGEVTLDKTTGEVFFADDCESTFIDAALKIVDRHPCENILFLTNSNSFAHVLAKRINQHTGGVNAAPWTGSESKADRDATKAQFMDENSPLRYIVGTITKAIAVGTDGLQRVCNIEVWLGKALESTLNEQGEGRLNRRGQAKDHIVRYELIVPDSAQEEDFARDARKFLQRKSELDSL